MVKISKLGYVVFILLVFATGWLSSTLYTAVKAQEEQPLSFNLNFLSPDKAKERSSPSDHIKESQIHVYNDRVIIELEDPHWSGFTDTNSMDPLIDEKSNGIEIKPKQPESIKVGDVISYKSEYADGIIIHRVIKTGEDGYGWYAIAKGDNNSEEDPGKIRFHQVEGILVGVLY